MDQLCRIAASAWVQRFISLIPPHHGPVLDLACGAGRHTQLLLDAGYEVWALDRDATLLQPLAAAGAKTFCVDLERDEQSDAPFCWPFQAHTFSGVIVTNYLHRPLFPSLKKALRPGGVLIYETFAQGNEQFGSPRNPAFLLQAGELLQLAQSDTGQSPSLSVIAYEHGVITQPKPAVVQRLCAVAIKQGDDLPKNQRLD